MKDCRIVSTDGAINIKIPMGDGPATITGGLGGWQTIDRQDDIAATDWVGQGPLTQDVPLLLDGYPDGESVERAMNTVFKLGRDARGNENVPPVFTIDGPIWYPDSHWVLPDGGIDLDTASTIRRDDGELLRQAFTLHLLEYVKPDQVKLRGKKKTPKHQRGEPGKTGGTAFPGKSYTVPKGGQSLHEIAAILYGDASEWKDIGKKNDIADPNRKQPAGTVLQLP
jgi:hypothetical protein